MSEVNMFELAARNKVRFPFKGQISTEDLFDLRVEELDIIFKALNAKVKVFQEESLLAEKTKADELLKLQIDIVKYVFNIKAEEKKAKLREKEIKEQKQKLLSIKAAKEDRALQEMSVEEIDKLLAQLGE